MTHADHSALAIAGGDPVIAPGLHQTWPDIRATDRAAILAVLDSRDVWSDSGPQVRALQEEYAEYCGVRYCHTVNSGTAALHCAIVASGVGPGDEVIVPAYTMGASAHAVLHAGATPVFCDIDPRTYTLDPALAERLVSHRTKAIMPVHIGGLMADMDAFTAMAARHDLALIEDFAQAHGATYDGHKAGTFGFASGSSVNGAKNLSGGEGGLFVTDNEEALIAARRLAVFGEDTPPLGPGHTRAFWGHGTGWNYRMPELTAAFVRARLPHLDDHNRTAQANAKILDAGLSQIPGLQPPAIPEGRESVYCWYRVRFDPAYFGWTGQPAELRDRLIYALSAEGIVAGTWQRRPVPAQPAFRLHTPAPWRPGRPAPSLKPWDRQIFPEASRLLDESLNLCNVRTPLHVQDPSLMHQYVDAVAKVVHHIGHVMTADYEPVAETPPVPDAAL
ncbi:MAG: DegT/DnrJ/EryC1/StrS family aminotransferase [Actinobacteria bacterium]|nr:DegT/DnrJ/EryC1/StrS family aminotransferase [Actinomycetota bacterium]